MSIKLDKFNSQPPTSFTVSFTNPKLKYIEGGKAIGRVKIFYAGQNRNGTYFSEEVAKELLKTLAGSPIVGEFDKEKNDFTQHTGIEQTRAYGFVPLESNIAIESHTDEDGETRDYYCSDVCLFTQRYDEAKLIVGKSQSMELNPDTIEGTWSIKGGVPIFEFTKAEFIGLCVLGDDMTPCFEGSSFYSKNADTQELIKQLKADFIQNIKSSEEKEGGMSMSKVINFKLSHGEIYSKLSSILNPNFNEEGNWEFVNGVIDVFDDYALVINYEEGKYYRVQYTKNDETNDLEVGTQAEVFIVDVTESEFKALEMLKNANGGSFELSEETITGWFTVPTEENVEEEATNEPAEITDEVVEEGVEGEEGDDFVAEDAPAAEEVVEGSEEEVSNSGEFVLPEEVNTELEELRKFKADTIKAEKLAKIDGYAEKLNTEQVEQLKGNLDSFASAVELEKEIAYILVTTTDFSTGAAPRVPNSAEENEDALTKILKQYVN